MDHHLYQWLLSLAKTPMRAQQAPQEQPNQVGWLLLQKHRLDHLLKQLEGRQELLQWLLMQVLPLEDHLLEVVPEVVVGLL